jgi:hypothetical protein
LLHYSIWTILNERCWPHGHKGRLEWSSLDFIFSQELNWWLLSHEVLARLSHWTLRNHKVCNSNIGCILCIRLIIHLINLLLL